MKNMYYSCEELGHDGPPGGSSPPPPIKRKMHSCPDPGQNLFEFPGPPVNRILNRAFFRKNYREVR